MSIYIMMKMLIFAFCKHTAEFHNHVSLMRMTLLIQNILKSILHIQKQPRLLCQQMGF